MHSFSVSRVIDAPKDTVWAVLDDYGDLADYDPKNATSQVIDGPETGLGAVREVVKPDGGRVVHEIVEYDPPNGYAFEFVEFDDTPAEELVLAFELTGLDDSRTRVAVTGRVQPKYGPLGWVLAKLVIVPKGKGLLRDLLAGLDDHLETRERVSADGRPDAGAAS